MEIFRLDKAIENEKLDMEMIMVQFKEAKEHLTQSLKRRKELAKEMNDHQYVETKIEELFPSSSSNEANEADNAIKELLEKNRSLQKEVRMLRLEQGIQTARFCEIVEQRNKMQEEIQRRDNDTQNEDLADQLLNANEEIRIVKAQNERIRNELNIERQISESLRRDLRSERQINESLENDLNVEKQVNERMMKSQVDMNQLNQQNEQNLHIQTGKAGLGYKEEGESSEQGAQRNQRPTCNHCGKTGHTSNKCWSNGKGKFKGKCFNCNQHGHKANECNEKPKFEGKCHKCKKQGHKASECRSKSSNPAEQIVKAIFGWDYNTWCRCHYCGEYGHIGANCRRHHQRKKDTTIRCYTCTELGHIAKNCMNIKKVEDEKKAKADNIRKQMKQQWIPKSTEQENSNDGIVTQGLSDSTISI